MANKIKYGLSNTYYALVTEDDLTGALAFGTPKAIKGAVELNIKAEGSMEPFSADNNQNYATIYTNNGYSGDITFAVLPDSFKEDCLGETVDTESGVVIENADAKPKYFALGGQFNGDQKNRRFWFYYCLASRPDITSKTTADKTDVQTDKLSITIGKRPDIGDVKAITSEATSDMIYNSWFSKVYEAAAGTEG